MLVRIWLPVCEDVNDILATAHYYVGVPQWASLLEDEGACGWVANCIGYGFTQVSGLG